MDVSVSVLGGWGSDYLLSDNLIYCDYTYGKENLHFPIWTFTQELFKVCLKLPPYPLMSYVNYKYVRLARKIFQENKNMEDLDRYVNETLATMA